MLSYLNCYIYKLATLIFSPPLSAWIPLVLFISELSLSLSFLSSFHAVDWTFCICRFALLLLLLLPPLTFPLSLVRRFPCFSIPRLAASSKADIVCTLKYAEQKYILNLIS
jgi:hypothetical protein